MDNVELTKEQVYYLAQLVDQDTAGCQDDPLYDLLMHVWNNCGDTARVVIGVENDDE